MAFVLATFLTGAGCASEPPKDPSFVLVELIPATTAAKAPRAARVVITNEATSALIAALCVNIEGEAGKPTASFVLRRDAGKNAAERIKVEVTPYELISGHTVDPGKEFACPGTIPPALGPPRAVSLDFCESQTRSLMFHVAAECCDGGAGGGGGGAGGAGGGGGGSASCGCEAGFVCGVGLTSAGKTCGPSTCCGQSISSTCALDL